MNLPKTVHSLAVTAALAINVPAAFSAGPHVPGGAPPGAAQGFDRAATGDMGRRDVAALVMGNGNAALVLPGAARDHALQASDMGAPIAADAMARASQSGNARGIAHPAVSAPQGAHGAEVSAMARDLAATARSTGGDYRDAVREEVRELTSIARQAPGPAGPFATTDVLPPAHGGMSGDAVSLSELARSLGQQNRSDPGAQTSDSISDDALTVAEKARKLSATAKKKPADNGYEDVQTSD